MLGCSSTSFVPVNDAVDEDQVFSVPTSEVEGGDAVTEVSEQKSDDDDVMHPPARRNSRFELSGEDGVFGYIDDEEGADGRQDAEKVKAEVVMITVTLFDLDIDMFGDTLKGNLRDNIAIVAGVDETKVGMK